MSDLLSFDKLVVNQKAKIMELTNEYVIRDVDGNEVGVIRQEGQSALKKIARFVSSFDQFMTHKLSVYDAAGTKVLELERPRKFLKSRLLVRDGSGKDTGQIVQKNAFGKIRFDLESSSGSALGQIKAENWRAWNFSIVDATDQEIGRITKTWEGLAKTLFTTADNYLVEIQPQVTGELRLLALAAAAGVDTALKQDSRGLS
jgi:uncharacterized protein YxjI